MIKKIRLLLTGTSILVLSAATTIQAQQPGGLQPKFSAQIKKDVVKFIQGPGDAAAKNTLQNDLMGIIQRTGADTKILSQIVSDAINEAANTHGHNIQKIGHVTQIATFSAASGALGAETAIADRAIENIARAVTFQYVSLTAKGDADPYKQLMLVTLAMGYGVTAAVLDHNPNKAPALLEGLARGALNGSITASYNHNFDATLTTSYAGQGLVLGMMQVTTAKNIEGAALCQAISKGAYSGTFEHTALQKPEEIAATSQAAIRGLLDGVFNPNIKAELDSKALATLADSTYQGVKDSFPTLKIPANVSTSELKEAAFDTWSTKMYSLIPEVDHALQEEIVTSLFRNSEGSPQRQAVISQGVIKVLQDNDKAKRALDLLPVMAEGAVTSILPNENIKTDNLSPFYTTSVERLSAGLPDTTVRLAYASLMDGSLNAVQKAKQDLVAHTQLVTQILATCAVKSSKTLNKDTEGFLKETASGLLETAVNTSLKEGLGIQEPAILVEAAVEGLHVGLVLGLVASHEPLDNAGRIVKSTAQAAAVTAVRTGKNHQLETDRVVEFALMSARGSTSGIVKLIENTQTGGAIKTIGAKLLEPVSRGIALGIFSSIIPAGGNALVNQQELVEFARTATFGATSGAVRHGSKENAPDYAESTANGSVLGITATATALFHKPENLETLKGITFAACKGAAMGAISAGADTNKDLKAIARRCSYGGTSAATLAAISAQQSPEVLSEICRMAARGTAQGTMEAAFRTLVGGDQPTEETPADAP